ncbi:MAG: deoxyribonuclease IV [Solirubrobacterales bacterium]
MLIGAHVSTAGGLVKAVARGTEIGAAAIQVFPQSPRAWRPTAYTEDDFAEFRSAMASSSLRSVVIHAIYLVNCASKEGQVQRNSRAALEHALRVGDGIGADGVVLHAGARKGEPHRPSVKRAGKAIARALEASETCPILLENTAGTQGPLGRDVAELAELIEAAGSSERLGTCLDCCHLLAAGYEIRTPEALDEFVGEFDATVGLGRLRCIHVNDSKATLGANRDLHAPLGKGELGERGLATFLSEPRFQGMPAILEGPGQAGAETEAADVEIAKRLRRRGNAARRRRARDPRSRSG